MDLFEKNNSNKNITLSPEEINNIINEVYAKDEGGRFKSLKFYDYKSDINFTGKKEDELNIDEIVRIKQSSTHLYEILESLTTSDLDAIKIVSKVLETSFNEIIFYVERIEDNLLYISIPVKGGDSLIIDPKAKEYLYAASCIDYDTHLKEFKNSRRTPQIY